ncbi:MAG: nucleotide-binding protein [Terriglobales bacterium]
MKPDPEYLKQLLTALQTAPNTTTDIQELSAAGLPFDDPRFEFHMMLLKDGGFLEGAESGPSGGLAGSAGIGLEKSADGRSQWSVIPLRLTASGHALTTREYSSDMARKPSSPLPKAADLPPEQTHAALKKQLVALDELRGGNHRNNEHIERGWTNLTNNILARGFGEDSNNVNQFKRATVVGHIYHPRMSESQMQYNFQRRLDAMAAVVQSSLSELELMGAGAAPVASVNEGVAIMKPNSRDVFLVHGHDETVKETVARFLEKLDLNPVILHERPNQGKTVIEKFEAHSDVGFAVVLLTPDDVGALASSPEKLNSRARQNVILELGYFIGKLSRARVCALYREGVEIPSDIHGVLYVPYDEGGGWRLKLANEIRAAGISVDMNRA